MKLPKIGQMVRHKNLVNFGQFLTTILCPIVVSSHSLHFNSRSRIFTRRNFRISRPIAGQLIFRGPKTIFALAQIQFLVQKISSSVSVQKYYVLFCLHFGIIRWSGRTQADADAQTRQIKILVFELVTCRARGWSGTKTRRPFTGLL